MQGLKPIKRFKYFMGIDQHKRYSHITVIDDIGDVVEEKKLYHQDKEEMLNYFKSFKPEEAKVVLEATGNWYWLADLLEEAKLPHILAHPYKTRIIAESKIKTDSISSFTLAQLLRAGLIPQSYLASKKTRLLREELRYRISLVKVRSSLKCRIHSILEREGITPPHYSDLFGKASLVWLKSLSLSYPLSQTLKGYLNLIESLNFLIEETEKSIKLTVKDNPLAQLLLSIPGIGFFTAYLILCEVVDITRFSTPKKLSSYIGIVGSIHQSGSFSHTGKITKQGNKYLRWALIEASQRAIIKEPYLKAIYDKISYKKGKQKAKVAVANKLAHIIWAVLKYRKPYTPKKKLMYSYPGQAR
jgi:transposase